MATLRGFHASLMYRERSMYGKDGWSSKRSSIAMKNSSQMVERLGLWKTLEGHDGCVNSVLFSNNGDRILTGSDDTIIKIFDSFSTECVDSIRTIHRNNIFYAKDLPGSNDLEWIVSCAADGQVVLTNRVSRFGRRIYKHQGRAHRISIIPDEPFQFLSCGEDGACCLFDLREHVGSLFSSSYGEDTTYSTLVNNNQLPSLKIEFFAGSSSSNGSRGRLSSIYSVGVNPVREHEVAVAGTTAKVALFDLRQATAPFAVLCPKHLVRHMTHFHVTGVKYAHDGSSLLASYNDEHVYLFDPVAFQRDPVTYAPRWEEWKCCNDNQSYGFLQVFKGHRNNETIKQVNFLGGRSKFVISGSDCGHAMIWNAADGSLLKVLKADSEGAVNCLDTHPTLPLLATSGLEHDAKLFLPIMDGDCRGLREEGSVDWRRARRVLKGNSHNLEDMTFPTPVIKLVVEETAPEGNDVESDKGSDSEEELRTRRNERQQWIMRLALQFLHHQRETAAAADQEAEQGSGEPPRSRRRLLFDSGDLSTFLEALTAGQNPLDDSEAEEDEEDDEEEEHDNDEDMEYFEEELDAEEQARMIFGDTQPDNEELIENDEVPLMIDDTTPTPAMVSLAQALRGEDFDNEDEDDEHQHDQLHIYHGLQAMSDDEDEMSLPLSPFPTPAHDMDEEVT